MPFFSIIVPVYKVEVYLAECIDSILSQNFGDYEIILVDDGSPDECPQICDNYANLDERIKVLHKTNGGLSDARNAGIDKAKGKYVLFVDSDDKIERNSLSAIYQTIEKNHNPDVVFLEARKFYTNGKTELMGDGYIEKEITGKSQIEVLQFISSMPKYPGSACSKAIKRDLLTDELKFVVGLISEDVEWSYRLFSIAKTYAYCETQYYWYRQNREGSITFSVNEDKINSLLWIVENWARATPTNEMDEIINSYVAYEYLVLLYNLSYLKENKAYYLDRVRKLKWVLSYGRNTKCRLVHFVLKIFDVNITSRMLRVYKG